MGIWQKRLDDLADEAIPLTAVHARLGLGRLKSWRTGFVEKEWRVDPEVCTGTGTGAQAVFGGYISALADQILSWAAMTVVDDSHFFRTSSLQVSFFRPVSGGSLRIEGRVVNQSSSLLHCEADFLREDGKLAAKAAAVQVLTPIDATVVAAFKLSSR